MNSGIIVELRMKSGDKLVALPRRYNMPSRDGKDLGIPHHAMDIRCPDESHGDMVPDPFHLALGEEATQLPAIGIAAYLHVHRRDSFNCFPFHLLGKQDQSRARSEGRHVVYWI